MVVYDAGRLHQGCGIMQGERKDNWVEVQALPL